MSPFVPPPGRIADGLKIGLLGGSFNPAHGGHVHISETALKRLGLDGIWWLVSPQNPLKPIKGMASLKERIAGARNIVRHPRIRVTAIEAELGTVYTADTLRKLTRRFPRVRFVWLMGSDNLVQIPKWRNWQAIFAMAPVAVVMRPGSVISGQMGTALQRFAHARKMPSARFALEKPPAIALLDGKRSPLNATDLRKTRF